MVVPNVSLAQVAALRKNLAALPGDTLDPEAFCEILIDTFGEVCGTVGCIRYKEIVVCTAISACYPAEHEPLEFNIYVLFWTRPLGKECWVLVVEMFVRAPVLLIPHAPPTTVV